MKKEILNLTFIREMMGNDETLVDKFLTIFETQCPLQMKQLRLHFNNKDWSSLSNIAHGMKTQFNYLSLENLATQIKQIENITDEGDRDKLALLIDTFEHDVNTFMIASA